MERSILIFDKFFLNAFEKQLDRNLYFPKYNKERKNILVELKQTGEINNQLFELMERNQETVLQKLVAIPNENFEHLNKILEVMS